MADLTENYSDEKHTDASLLHQAILKILIDGSIDIYDLNTNFSIFEINIDETQHVNKYSQT
ncbi:MAG: hypothetical protein H0U73_07440 [Tatlockia sp.]|nr:hypothetical protein [Tatlockia sp.]